MLHACVALVSCFHANKKKTKLDKSEQVYLGSRHNTRDPGIDGPYFIFGIPHTHVESPFVNPVPKQARLPNRNCVCFLLGPFDQEK